MLRRTIIPRTHGSRPWCETLSYEILAQLGAGGMGWKNLLTLYPDYERKEAVQQLIAEAKQHGRTVVFKGPKS